VINLLQRFSRGAVLGAAAALALSVIPSGCKKHASENVAPPTPLPGDEAPLDPKVAADLEDINKLVRAYVQSTKVIPKTVDELVTRGFVRALPEPPPGKTFAIRLQPFGYRVVLVDNN
jgi:hypothetical protein